MMMEVIETIFGPYTLIDGHVNYGWIAGVVVFCIVLYSALRMLAMAVFKK